VNLLQVLPATTRKLKSNDAARVYSPLQKSSPQSVQDKTRSSTTPDLFLVFLICGSIANWRFSKARALFSSFFSSTNLNHASLKFPTSSITKIILRILFFVRHCQNLRIFFCVKDFDKRQLVKTKRQANFKDFKRFEAFKGLVEQKNLVFNSFVCKLGLFWHSWGFKTLVSLK
jgi:hypothetical protein